MYECVVCGSKKVAVLIKGRPYCQSCASKVIQMHVVRQLNVMKREKLIPSTFNIPEI